MKIKSLFTALQQFRQGNADKYKLTKLFVLFIYPLLIITICEFCLFQSLEMFTEYFLRHINILLFLAVFECAIYVTLLLISKSMVIATGINSFVLFLFTCIEFYKYRATGTHLVITDLSMAGNASDLTHFSSAMRINPLLVLGLLILIAFTVATYFLNFRFQLKYAKSFAFGCVSLALTITMFTVPALSMNIYDAFDINDDLTKDSFSSNDRFNENRFLTFFIQSATDVFKYSVKEPADYSREMADKVLALPANYESTTSIKPNIIFILSESYGDFRQLENNYNQMNGIENQQHIANIPENAYTNYDKMASEGFKGSEVLPTFGGYTSRSEFEIIFGLPVHSLNSPTIPHYKLKNRAKQPTLVQELKESGYSAAYIHPFGGNFYNRSEIYSNYGFDRLIFDDDFTVPVELYKSYISDKTLYNQAIDIIKSTDESDYVMAMSMQNHMPFSVYDDEENLIAGEESEYFNGVEQTDEALGYLMDELRSFDEPTIVVFSGDHFPFFTDENSIYRQFGIDKSNSYILYKSSYIIWSNYPIDYTNIIPEARSEHSLFYLPYIALDLAGIPKSRYMQTMEEQMAVSPVYSPSYPLAFKRNPTIDFLTYDRIVGKSFSENNDD